MLGDGTQWAVAKAGGANQRVLYVESVRTGYKSIQAHGGP
jgi:hypothetical protein